MNEKDDVIFNPCDYCIKEQRERPCTCTGSLDCEYSIAVRKIEDLEILRYIEDLEIELEEMRTKYKEAVRCILDINSNMSEGNMHKAIRECIRFAMSIKE